MSGLVDEIAASAAIAGVPSALASARDGIDALLRDRGLRRTTPALVSESLLQGAAASARLEGSQTGLEELRNGEGDEVATSAARLNAELLSLIPVVARSPLQALARMHTVVALDRVHPERLGRPRPAEGLGAGLQALSACLLTTTALPAIAVAAVAHAEIVTLSPFDGYNGLVGRALERLVLVARGVDPTSMLVPEAGHLALSAGYWEALTAYSSRDAAGRRAWLLHCVEALTWAVDLSPLR